MVFSTSIGRPKQKSFKSRTDYFRTAEEVNPRICHVIAEDAANAPQAWLTLVLGSGCASSQADGDSLLGVLQRVCESARHEGEINGEPLDRAVLSFAEALIKDRLRLQECKAAEGTTYDGQADWLFDLFVAAALLSKLYFRVKSLGFEAPHRAGHPDVATLTKESQAWARLVSDHIGPCREALSRLENRVDEIVDYLTARARAIDETPDATRKEEKGAHLRETVRETVTGILQQVLDDLDSAGDRGLVEVRLASVHSLAEFAWLCLASALKEEVYPGWGDLLLDLSNYDAPGDGRVGMPMFKSMLHAHSYIRSRYLTVTKRSWARRLSGETGGRMKLYRQAATLLNAQHQHRQRETSLHKRPPVVTAFVTSFDVELELSLLEAGKAFTVVLPVHVYDPRSGLAQTCWVGLHVPEASGKLDGRRLDDLMSPDAGRWHVADNQSGEAGPVIIRLAGCPLIELPSLALDPGGEMEGLSDDLQEFVRLLLPQSGGAGEVDYDEARCVRLAHAVVINEHDARVQGVLDLVSIPTTTRHEVAHYGLPIEYAAGTRMWSRFWMMLGVQVQDTALRQRIATVVSSLPLKSDALPDRGKGLEKEVDQEGEVQAFTPARRSGVAVNMYATELERDLLLWNGFDIVEDDALSFAEDLEHYAEHMISSRRIQRLGECCA